MSENCPRCGHDIGRILDVSDWDSFYDGRIGRCPNCRVYHRLDSADKPSEAGDENDQ